MPKTFKTFDHYLASLPTDPQARQAQLTTEYNVTAILASREFGKTIKPKRVAKVFRTKGGNFYSKIDRWIWNEVVDLHVDKL